MGDLPAVVVVNEGRGLQLVAGAGQLDRHPAAVYLAGLAPGSRASMGGALDAIARLVTSNEEADRWAVPWAAMRYQHTAAIRAALAERYAHSTANKMLSALRGTLRAAWRLGLLGTEEYQKAIEIEPVKGETVPAGRAIASGELVAMLDSCDQSATGIRDAAIISLLYGAGLRRAEVVGLDRGDYDRQAGRLVVRGKRNKQRALPLTGGAAAALGDWLAVRGDEPGPLFLGTGNRQRGARLTTQAVYTMLKRRAAAAGVKDLSPHDFRRTFVGDLLDAGADIATVQKMAGHADPATTSRYDRRGEEAKRKAAELLHVPYRRRTLAQGD